MLLSAYQAAVYSLIQAPSSPTPLIPAATITSYINTARSQTAADAECLRISTGFALSANPVSFQTITGHTGDGTSHPISIRQLILENSTWPLENRSWEWFSNYTATGNHGTPTMFAQQGQGSLGTLWFYPVPNQTYFVFADATMLPIPLVSDSTPDAIPYPWTDAVSFYAAWLALMQLQRAADADAMLSRYKELALRGRQESTSTYLPDNYQGGQAAQIATSKTTLTQRPGQSR